MTHALFDLIDIDKKSLGDYLNRLELEAQKPSLTYLNQLILKHQEKVPFENLTRICDFKEQKTKFADLKTYLERLPSGSGGVCWSLARGFHWLLNALEFNVSYIYADPGHVCLLVTLEQPYYVDVGYGAPFFKAMPLKQSFKVESSSEVFDYQASDSEALIVRTPGPTKTLYFTPSHASEIQSHFESRNIWGESKFLSTLLVAKYDTGHVIRLKDGVFQDYRSGKVEARELSEKEIANVLIDEFKMDPALYDRARRYLIS